MINKKKVGQCETVHSVSWYNRASRHFETKNGEWTYCQRRNTRHCRYLSPNGAMLNDEALGTCPRLKEVVPIQTENRVTNW